MARNYRFDIEIEAVCLKSSISEDGINKPTTSNTLTLTTKNKGSVLYGTYDDFNAAARDYFRIVNYLRS